MRSGVTQVENMQLIVRSKRWFAMQARYSSQVTKIGDRSVSTRGIAAR
jgi:hypothetical protein